jgi:hypothetical protein
MRAGASQDHARERAGADRPSRRFRIARGAAATEITRTASPDQVGAGRDAAPPSVAESVVGIERVCRLAALEVAGERVPLRLDPTIHQTDHQLDIEAATTVDQRLLGMTWSPLGMTRTPATLTVHARLRRQS